MSSLICPNNDQPVQLTLSSPCVSQISTNDSTTFIDSNINPDGYGIDFSSNVPVTITIQLNCDIQMTYMCLTGNQTNIEQFSYSFQNMYNDVVSSSLVDLYDSDDCFPGDLNMAGSSTQLIVTILKTNDDQPPRNFLLDLQGCYLSSVRILIKLN